MLLGQFVLVGEYAVATVDVAPGERLRGLLEEEIAQSDPGLFSLTNLLVGPAIVCRYSAEFINPPHGPTTDNVCSRGYCTISS